jgi:hypothetical protein
MVIRSVAPWYGLRLGFSYCSRPTTSQLILLVFVETGELGDSRSRDGGSGGGRGMVEHPVRGILSEAVGYLALADFSPAREATDP